MIERHDDVTVTALDAMRHTDDPRLREILTSLVGHLHGWIADVALTEAEFRSATAIVNEYEPDDADTEGYVEEWHDHRDHV